MKKLLALLPLIGIIGCASYPKYDDTYFDGYNISEYRVSSTANDGTQLRNFGYRVSNIYEYSFDIITYGNMITKVQSSYYPAWVQLCDSVFSSTFLSITEPDTIWRFDDGTNFKYPNKLSIQCKDPDVWKKEKEILLKQQEDTEKYYAEQMAIIEAKRLEERKSICRTYGFKDETDGMGLCLIELDKLDAIKEQISANNLAQSNLIAQQQEAAQAQALINLGAIISGAGVPNNPQPIPSSPSYPESYSMSRTVPSNQNCPLLGVPLKKQEVKNGNRICYY
tara:strand:+ start:195 stop:1034 length:840 start_codon:yes stop_codon:yes gene_type:complete